LDSLWDCSFGKWVIFNHTWIFWHVIRIHFGILFFSLLFVTFYGQYSRGCIPYSVECVLQIFCLNNAQKISDPLEFIFFSKTNLWRRIPFDILSKFLFYLPFRNFLFWRFQFGLFVFITEIRITFLFFLLRSKRFIFFFKLKIIYSLVLFLCRKEKLFLDVILEAEFSNKLFIIELSFKCRSFFVLLQFFSIEIKSKVFGLDFRESITANAMLSLWKFLFGRRLFARRRWWISDWLLGIVWLVAAGWSIFKSHFDKLGSGIKRCYVCDLFLNSNATFLITIYAHWRFFAKLGWDFHEEIARLFIKFEMEVCI
jgi:hypothetical protein